MRTVPEMFGRYELHDLLGRGGMGEVYTAVDTVRDRTVALKLLPKHLASDESFKTRFRRESQMAARLNDPHIIPIHDFGEIDGQLFIDMRLVKGRDLGSVLQERGSLPPGTAVKIIAQVASALEAAHDAGLVHRDVKPSNVLLSGWTGSDDAEPFAYLVDFGIARAANQEGTALTATSATVGTVAYMSPERIGGSPGDRRTDIYALGAVLFEVIAGRKPFDGEMFAMMYAHMNTAVPRVTDFVPDAPPALDAVIVKAMAKDPDDRYPTCSQFALAARQAMRSGSPQVQPSPQPAPPHLPPPHLPPPQPNPPQPNPPQQTPPQFTAQPPQGTWNQPVTPTPPRDFRETVRATPESLSFAANPVPHQTPVPQHPPAPQPPTTPPWTGAQQQYPPGPPSQPAKKNRTLALVAAAALVLVVAIVVAVVALGGSDSPQAGGPSSSPVSSPSSPSSSSSESIGGVPSEDSAKQTAERYFDDLNANNSDDAAKLICAAQLTTWQKGIASKDSDFTLHVNTKTFLRSSVTASGRDITYRVNATKETTKETGNIDVTFTMVPEDGLAKICDERVATSS